VFGYLPSETICSSRLTVVFKLRSRKTVRFSEQIMSVDKYSSIFVCQTVDKASDWLSGSHSYSLYLFTSGDENADQLDTMMIKMIN